MSWLAPSKSSASVFFPSGPSNTYSLAISCRGSARRAAESLSRLRVSAFSFASNFLRAASQAFSETTLGRDTARFRKMLLPVRRIELVAAHALAGRRCVDESAIAEIDADVRALLALEVEEDEVAAPQARGLHRA